MSGRTLALVFLLFGASATAVEAQARPTAPRPQPATVRTTTSVRAFGDIGQTIFAAKDSFEATLGSATVVMFGAGAEVVLPQQIFFGVRVSRFTAEGERVFVHNNQTFSLGIPMTVTLTPVQITGGLRFGRPRSPLVPFVGGGVGWYRYEETSEFAESSDNASESFTGYHILGGVEYRLSRLLGLAGEAQWATVANALGQDPTSVGSAFGEDNLGGVSVRVKVVVGR